jgi:hypothetical protein
MGTNYYLELDVCDKCGRPGERLHIGKSSMGWCFGLHVTESWEERQISSLEDWKRLWSQPDAVIVDEYGERISPDQMLEIITEREGTPKEECSLSEYYSSWEEMLRKNCAIWGPNNLLRHDMAAARHHKGYGDGTWDLLSGEFS